MNQNTPPPSAVNPSHYKGLYGFECSDMLLHMFGKEAREHFYLLNAVKYIYRFERKNGLEDLQKAEWYLNALWESSHDGNPQDVEEASSDWKVKLAAFASPWDACMALKSILLETLAEHKGVTAEALDMVAEMQSLVELQLASYGSDYVDDHTINSVEVVDEDDIPANDPTYYRRRESTQEPVTMRYTISSSPVGTGTTTAGEIAGIYGSEALARHLSALADVGDLFGAVLNVPPTYNSRLQPERHFIAELISNPFDISVEDIEHGDGDDPFGRRGK